MSMTPAKRLRRRLEGGKILPAIGVYDVFSASVAGRQFDAVFLSGFSFAASHYGLPDIGFIAWPDMVALAQRVRGILPDHHLIVDIDDGYCDAEVACHVVSELERAGASAVILEDQQRPRRCGHFEGKEIMPLEGYLKKLEKVLSTRRELLVIARTDASDAGEILRRARAFSEAGADVILADGIRDLSLLGLLSDAVDRPIAFNQMRGGKSPACSLSDLQGRGVSLAIFSTPCLFAAQAGMESELRALKRNGGLLPGGDDAGVGMAECSRLLAENLARRDKPRPLARRNRATMKAR